MIEDVTTFAAEPFISVICLLLQVAVNMYICAATSVIFHRVIMNVLVPCMDINTFPCKIVAFLAYSNILASAFL